MEARVRFGPVRRNPLRRSCVSRVRNAGESAFWPGPGQPSAETVCVEGAKCAFWPGPGQPSAEIARVEGAKRRRECVLARSGATLCGDRASRARNAGESASWPGPVQLCAEIVRVECRVHEMQVRVRFGLVALHFWRKACTKRSLWRLGASLLRKSRTKRWFWRLGASFVERYLKAGSYLIYIK